MVHSELGLPIGTKGDGTNLLFISNTIVGATITRYDTVTPNIVTYYWYLYQWEFS